ncbi:MAG: hypothetical protein AAF526_00615, partial [Pseudomonadota bacterium]
KRNQRHQVLDISKSGGRSRYSHGHRLRKAKRRDAIAYVTATIAARSRMAMAEQASGRAEDAHAETAIGTDDAGTICLRFSVVSLMLGFGALREAKLGCMLTYCSSRIANITITA